MNTLADKVPASGSDPTPSLETRSGPGALPRPKALVAWSGGKDSALALHEIRTAGEYEVVSLLTTVTQDYDRISMHGVRRALLERQAEALGLPLEIVFISKTDTNADYEAKMAETLTRYQTLGVSTVVFGDIFLEDLRQHREDNLAQIGMKGAFPIWQRDTAQMSRSFIAAGFKAIITCVDAERLDGAFAGRLYDEQLLTDLPEGVDPCGENGEFHSFAYDGPIFQSPVPWTRGEVVVREDRFHFCDLMPDPA